ncbi:D(2)-like dopamine receptor [Carassius gibelio]|uniref:D(2)-like dopamine receptor n=1 Tax=Carassius gibelio TaxID=101364 RepID=UPI002278E49B|nr:D(2)-like dopamine receptor [Carassius gibelio]XP_052413497.1 D(2)-like dopamine receptor [Carassius gibelio]XP_052413498.1 D(2)-like dopamine receptor [Carassius gibelio]
MEFLTEYPYNDTYYDNGTGSLNSTSCEAKHQYNYYALLLTLLIFVIVFGNVLVCMAVSREKALQTTTNYLIVSLAVADLLVATLVMPWVVYLEVVGEWRFSKIHCDVFVTLDVMMCTASILNLCAISIDRYTAVAMPMLYNTRYSSKRRVTVMISVVWVLSFAISCPLLFGLNNTATRDDTMCEIANPAFVVYSSIMSFYVPFIITLLVYVQIYVVLRKRRKRVNTKRSCQKTDADAKPPLKEKCTHPEDVKLCTVIIKTNGGLPAKNKKAQLIKEVLHQGADVRVDVTPGTSSPEKKKLESTLVVDLLANPSPIHGPLSHNECQSNGDDKNGHAKEVQTPKEAKLVETQALHNGKTQTTLTKTMSKRKMYQHKEKKATQMLAIVLGVFIICWLPFFITHILKTHCTSCVVPLEMYNAFTWLGYVNSAVNPIIYTTFNVEFRKAFIKILHC